MLKSHLKYLLVCIIFSYVSGFLIDFISGPVSAGFTTAAAISIAMTQVKDLLGLNYGANKFMEVWDQLSKHFREISTWDAVLGFSCMFVLLLLRVSNNYDPCILLKFINEFKVTVIALEGSLCSPIRFNEPDTYSRFLSSITG